MEVLRSGVNCTPGFRPTDRHATSESRCSWLPGARSAHDLLLILTINATLVQQSRAEANAPTVTLLCHPGSLNIHLDQFRPVLALSVETAQGNRAFRQVLHWLGSRGGFAVAVIARARVSGEEVMILLRQPCASASTRSFWPSASATTNHKKVRDSAPTSRTPSAAVWATSQYPTPPSRMRRGGPPRNGHAHDTRPSRRFAPPHQHVHEAAVGRHRRRVVAGPGRRRQDDHVAVGAQLLDDHARLRAVAAHIGDEPSVGEIVGVACLAVEA